MGESSAPPAVPGADGFTTFRDTSITFLASTLLANDSDPDGDEIAFYGLSRLPSHGGLSVDGLGPEDIIYRYTPHGGFVGSDSFDYTVQDARGATATGTVTITVTAQGFAGNPDFFMTPADTRLRVLSTDLTSNDSPGAVFIRAENARHGTLSIAGIGPEATVYDFQPDAGFLGEAGFDYLISPDGSEPSTRVVVTIQVGDGPPSPAFDASCSGLSCSFDGSATTDDVAVAGYAWSFGDGATAVGVTAAHAYGTGASFLAILTVTDSRGQTASTSQVMTVDALPVPSFTVTCSGLTCTFDASGTTDDAGIASYAWAFGDGATGSGVTASRTYAVGGSYSVKLTVTDSMGQTAQKTQSIAVNRPPVAAGDAGATARNTPMDLNVLANDSDPDGHALSVTAWSQGAHGGVTKNANGTLRYSPHAGYTGPDGFTYTVSDGNGGTASATVGMTVTLPNNPPDARDDGWRTSQNGPTNIPYSHLLANDYDPNGDPLAVTNVGTAGLTGTLDCSSGTYCRYSPPSGFVGMTSFTYSASDGKGGTDPATVRIKVGVANGLPVPQDEILETTRNTALTFTRATLLVNDSDPDGDVLSVTGLFRAPLTAFGTVSCSAAHYVCTYTPPAGFTASTSSPIGRVTGPISRTPASASWCVRRARPAWTRGRTRRSSPRPVGLSSATRG